MSALAKYIAVAIPAGATGLSALVPAGQGDPDRDPDRRHLGPRPTSRSRRRSTIPRSPTSTTRPASSSPVTVGGVSRYIALDPTYFVGLTSIKIRSGTSGTPVNQTGAPTITLITREY